MNTKIIGVVSYFPLESAYIRSAKSYTDILEVRVDLISEYLEAIQKLKRIKPIILTVRSEREGGRYFPKRREAYLELMDYADYVDVELSSYDEMTEVIFSAHAKKKRVILSYHSFERMPSVKDFDRMLVMSEEKNADVFKAAVLSSNPYDIVELAFWVRKASMRKRGVELCVMCMGDERTSLLSRVVLPVFGVRYVYGKLGRLSGAPGQPDVKTLHTILKGKHS